MRTTATQTTTTKATVMILKALHKVTKETLNAEWAKPMGKEIANTIFAPVAKETTIICTRPTGRGTTYVPSDQVTARTYILS